MPLSKLSAFIMILHPCSHQIGVDLFYSCCTIKIAMKKVIITNNPLVESEYKNTVQVDFSETDVHGVLLQARDLIHNGYKLLTHPLSGSIKPNESPYKTVILVEGHQTNFESVEVIEKSIATVKKFPQKEIKPEHLKDMQIIDLDHIKTAT